MKKGHIFFIMGISGSGKGTLINGLKKQSDTKLEFLRSYVTRPIRQGEIEGNIYYFISLEEFNEGIKNNEFLEYELNHGLYYYGTKKSDLIENGINKSKNVLKEIEVKGLRNIFKNNPNLKENITSIFLDINEETLAQRISGRGAYMSKQELSNRKDSLILEKKESALICDYIIDTSNITPDQFLEKVIDIIKKY